MEEADVMFATQMAAVLDLHCHRRADPDTGQVECGCGWFGAFGHFPMHQAMRLVPHIAAVREAHST